MEIPKFIITMDGYLRFGMVSKYKDLLIEDDQSIGGGYYQFDWSSSRLLLDRASYDFGRPSWHLLDTLNVPEAYRGLRIVYVYNDDFHEDYNVSDVKPCLLRLKALYSPLSSCFVSCFIP
jgi:hypothetical protein